MEMGHIYYLNGVFEPLLHFLKIFLFFSFTYIIRCKGVYEGRGVRKNDKIT